METRMINKEEIEMMEHAKLGKRILNEIEKMKRGEYPGIFLVMPVRLNDGGFCRVQIELPRKVEWIAAHPYHYMWSVDAQEYVLIDDEEGT